MGEYVQSDPGSGGVKWGVDAIDEGGDLVTYPRTKLIHGADGVNAGDVSVANPLPTGLYGDGLTALQLLDDIVAQVDGAGGLTPKGVLGLALRDDALSALTPVEGDYVGLRVDANGALWVIPSGTVAVSVASLPLPSGAATAANQATIIGHVDGLEGLLTTIDADTGAIATAAAAIQAAVETLDNAIAGSEMQVDVVGPLPAGTNAIGKLAANSGIDIGDVDVTSVTPGFAASSLGKRVDDAAGAADVGMAPLAVRDDALAALTPADGDYVPLRVDANGALWVIPSGTVAVSVASLPLPSGAATEATLSTAAASLGVLDDWDESDRAKVNLIAGQAGITGGSGTVAANTPRVVLATDVALPAGTNAIGKLAANSGVDIGDVDVTSVPADPFGANADAASATGSISAKLRFIASTGIPITGTVTVGSHAVTNAGTFAVQVDGAALTALQLIDDIVFADDGNGFTVGTSKGAAVMFLADETATDSVDEGDVGIARMTLDRKIQACVEIESSSIRAAGTSLTPKFAIIDAASSGNNTLVAAVTSKKIRVLAAYMVAAGTVNVRFEDGADGTAKSGQMNLVANTGFVLPFSPVGWFEGTATTLLNLELSAAVSVDGGLVYVEV